MCAYDLMLHLWSGTIYGECLHVPEVEYVPKLGAVCRSMSGNALDSFTKKGPFGLLVEEEKGRFFIGPSSKHHACLFSFNRLF